MLVHLSDMSMLRPMITPDYQATHDVWDWDAMPEPTAAELAAVTIEDTDTMLDVGDLY